MRRTMVWFHGLAVLLAAVLGVGVAAEPSLVIGGLAVLILASAVWRRPRLAFALWLISVCSVPYWVGIDIAGFLPAPTLIGLLAIVSVSTSADWKPHRAEFALVALVLFAGAGVALFGSSLPVWFTMLSHWCVGYFLARRVAPVAGIRWVESAVAVAFCLVAVATVAEWALDWHPFETLVLPNPSYEIWGPLLERAGSVRSEWALGHPIALGGSLALAIPFVTSLRISIGKRMVLLALILAAIGTTNSRGAIIAAALTVLLTIIMGPRGRNIPREALALAAVGGLVVGFQFYGRISDSAGSEASLSSQYRISMYRLVDTLNAIGRADSFRRGPNNTVFYERFSSIDNGFLAIGLGFGFLAMAVAVAAVVVMIVRIVRRRASLSEVALVGNLPVLTTVAMITQYQIVVFFFVGLAVATAVRQRRSTAVAQADENKAQVGATSA